MDYVTIVTNAIFQAINTRSSSSSLEREDEAAIDNFHNLDILKDQEDIP